MPSLPLGEHTRTRDAVPTTRCAPRRAASVPVQYQTSVVTKADEEIVSSHSCEIGAALMVLEVPQLAGERGEPAQELQEAVPADNTSLHPENLSAWYFL